MMTEKKLKKSATVEVDEQMQEPSCRSEAVQSRKQKPSATIEVDEKKFQAALEQRLAEITVEISGKQLAQLTAYYKMLVETNRVMNLTGIVEAEEVAEKHIADSLRLIKYLPEADEKNPASIIDVGTGAGLPGIPLAVALPQTEVILLDSQRKRCDFLERVCGELGLANARVVWGRAEEIAHFEEFREQHGSAVARAVAALPVLLEYLAPLVRTGGRVIAMKGSNAAEELSSAAGAIRELNLRQLELAEYQLTDGSGRSLAVLEKTAAAKAKYPRGSGQIKKKPL